MESTWSSIFNFIFLALFLAIAALLKDKFKFFSKFLIPTSIIAGFIGLFLGPDFLNLVPLDMEGLGDMVYHLMAIGFIALALKERNREKKPESFRTGIYIVSTYLVQGIVGFSISLGLFYTILPDIFPTFGFLLPLGYGQGPGQAYSIGTQWEALGFQYGSQVGLSIATLGFLWACFGGVFLLNFLVKKKKRQLTVESTNIVKKNIVEESEPGEIPLNSGLDKITVQLFLIGIVYLLTFVTIKGLSIVLQPLGLFGQTLSQLFWGFHFLIGTIYAMVFRLIYDFAKKRNFLKNSYPNNYLLQRISGACFDYMITASIAALSVSAIKNSIVPLLIITSIGGIATIFYTIAICKKVYKTHVLEYIVALYGMLTGTISTGMALLREVDPEFNTRAAENLVMGSAIALPFGFPLLMILNMPIVGYVSNQPIYYFYTLGALILYFIVMLLILLRMGTKK